ncbi:hypothetical protein P2R12_05340 [Cytobacillus oceanisediminis]|uniref:hypothetical protein n=1 Tax=Cytobacillus oceanisediminis TaxID=665099 RepID=UPI0023DA95AF|nr:hypothetical protein [Cytobacillus oceanisediminis]MDF2036417.1 hypothetical protein [Cytobacillus oceanisediminis]
MANNNQRFQGCCPLTPIPKPPKQRCICPPGRRGRRGRRGPRGPQGPPGISQTQSAFRAVKTVSQFNIGGFPTKVEYETQQFDLNNEYDPFTSTFVPSQKGVYSIIASLEFVPNIGGISYSLLIEIRVGGNTIALDSEQFIGTVEVGRSVFSVLTIYQLEAGDEVEVFASTGAPGGGEARVNAGTHFEARFPSPN